MKKRSISIFLLMLSFFSCGTPSYFTMTVDTSISTLSVVEELGSAKFDSIVLSDIYVNTSDQSGIFSTSEVSSYSPGVTLFYIISEIEQASYDYSSLNSKFNSTYATEGSYGNNRNISIDSTLHSVSSTTRTKNDKSMTLTLHPFMNESGDNGTGPQCTFNKTDGSFSTSQNKYFFDVAMQKETESDKYYIYLRLYDDANKTNIVGTKKLYRYNGSSFVKYNTINGNITNSKNVDYNGIQDGSKELYVTVCFAVNVTGGSNASFSNTYWSKLKPIAYFPIPQ